MTYEQLLIETDKKGLITKEKPLRANMVRINENRIAIKSDMTEIEKKCILAGKLNHYYTDTILQTQINDFNKIMLQEWINNYCAGHSPKSVRNAYMPNDSEIQELINYYKEHDKDMLAASCLAAFGTLRRSEVCGRV